MTNSLGTVSIKKLETCDPRLVKLINAVACERNITVLYGVRTEQEQDEAFELGHSEVQWPHSKHNSSPSMAVDIAPYPINWHDIDGFKALAVVVKAKAKELGINIKWGGDFKSFFDGPHYQLEG